MLQNKLTIVVPTLNRSLFLTRALDYYMQIGYDGSIIVGDSSNDWYEKTQNQKAIKDSGLDIQYYHFPLGKISHDAVKTHFLLDKIKTPYVTLAGDDDFQIPNGLIKCVEFLENHPDYISAHGNRINFTLDNIVYGNITGLQITEGYGWDTNDPIARWHEYIECGIATTSYVHRTYAWKKYYAYSHKAKSNYIGNELIPCSLCAILGKVKKLDCLSTVFQRDNPIRKFSFEVTTLWDLIHGKYWLDSVKIFEEAMVSELSKVLSKEEAKTIFYREFWYHCLLVMNSQFSNKYSDKKENPPEEPLDISGITEEDDLYPICRILQGA
jgi:glycosyltransferase domain-containing protein